MEELKVNFGEWTYKFNPCEGYWECEEDETTMSTDMLLRWLKHDARIEHDRFVENAQ